MADLFEKCRINRMRMKNRFVRAATWSGLANDSTGAPTPGLADLMATLAAGGAGTIITGHAYVHPNGKHSFRQLGIHTDTLLPSLEPLTQTVHINGANLVAQLGYGGAYLSRSRVRSMTPADIHGVVDAFSSAAKRAETAGFDGVQVMAAHGFLLSQMLCPRYNDRTDAYGGALENRARPLIETVRAIREAVGPGYPVLVKLNGEDFVDGGLTLNESVSVAEALEKAGADAIEVSGGLLNNPNLMPRKSHMGDGGKAAFETQARSFKQRVSIPLILGGGIRSLALCRRILKEELADFIAMCRPFIREPNLINKWQNQDPADATCISCNNCMELLKRGDGLTCVPLKESEPDPESDPLFREVTASPPYPPATTYRISLDVENWDTIQIPVVRVKLVHNGKVTDRIPSYPLGSDDHLRVSRAIDELTGCST